MAPDEKQDNAIDSTARRPVLTANHEDNTFLDEHQRFRRLEQQNEQTHEDRKDNAVFASSSSGIQPDREESVSCSLNEVETRQESPPAPLPADILSLIVDNIADRNTLKQLRLCCKWLSSRAAEELFRVIYVGLYEAGMERMVKIASSEALARSVKTLYIFERQNLERLDSEEWCNYITELDESEIFLHMEDKRQLHEEYCEEVNEYDRSTISDAVKELPYIRVRGSREMQMRGRPSHEWTRYQRVYSSMDDALLKFVNLRDVLFDSRKRYRMWRGFMLSSNIYDYDNGDPEGAAAVAFILRALGWRNSLSSSLTFLKINLSWGPEHVQAVWEACNGSDHSLAATQISLMEDAFIHLKVLDLTIWLKREPNMGRDTVSALAGYFRNTSQLEVLAVTIHTCELLSKGKFCDPERVDVLSLIMGEGRWSRLKGLNLTMDMSMASLHTLLSTAASTLQWLRLLKCTLVGEGDSWPRAYEAMRSIDFAALQDLAFETCFDFCPDESWQCEAWNYPDDAVTHLSVPRNDLRLKWHSPALYDYILKKTNEIPLLIAKRNRNPPGFEDGEDEEEE